MSSYLYELYCEGALSDATATNDYQLVGGLVGSSSRIDRRWPLHFHTQHKKKILWFKGEENVNEENVNEEE